MRIVFECESKSKGFCNGKDLKVVQLKTTRNVFNGDVILMCKGCRLLHNGGFKYSDKELTR